MTVNWTPTSLADVPDNSNIYKSQNLKTFNSRQIAVHFWPFNHQKNVVIVIHSIILIESDFQERLKRKSCIFFQINLIQIFSLKVLKLS